LREPEFSEFLARVSRTMPVSMLAREAPLEKHEKCIKVDEGLPVFDALDLLEHNDCLALENGKTVRKKYMLKRPLRIMFFVLLTELESKLYRTQEWSGMPLEELNDKTFNDFVRFLVDDKKLYAFQKEYSSKKEFREDLKAASSFRNLMAHVNKKLEMETDFDTVLKRKHQILRLLRALAEILDCLECERKNAKV